MAATKHVKLENDIKSRKTHRKRKLSDETNNEKKPKVDAFNETKFKFMLKSGETVYTGLEQFIKEAKHFDDTGEVDIIQNYCVSSRECSEIIQLLDGGTKKRSEVLLIFESLELILLRIADDLDKFKSTAQNIVNNILTTHLGLIYSSLSMKNKSVHIKGALKLLTAMVMQVDSGARDVQLQLNLKHPSIAPLYNRRDTKDPQDVRTCLINLVMAFLISGDNGVIKHLIESGIVQLMFEGLVFDKVLTVQMVLSSFMDRIILNSGMNKTIRIRVFNETSLKNLVKLYKWTGPRKWKDTKKKKVATKDDEDIEQTDDTDVEELDIVRNLVHEFLVELFSSVTNGINFYDKSLGTSGKNNNHVITNVLTKLNQPYLHDLQSELITKTLVVCPDLLHWYLPCISHGVEPRASNAWLKCVNFLIQIYENQVKVLPALNFKSSCTSSELVNMAMRVLVPPKEIWTHIIAAVKSTDRLVQHEGLKLLLVIMKRVTATITECLNDTSEKAATYREFIQLFREIFKKMLPNTFIWMSLWNVLVTDITGKEAAEKDEKTSLQVHQISDEASIQQSGLPQVSAVENAVLLLQAIDDYMFTIPPDMQSESMDQAALLEGVQQITYNIHDKEASLLWLSLFKLLSQSRDGNFQWAKLTKNGKSFLYLLLETITLTSKNENLNSLVRDLVVKMFQPTGLFEGTAHELQMWVDLLINIDEKLREKALLFMEQVFIKVLKDPYTYIERVLEYMTEAGSMEDTHMPLGDTQSVATTSDALIDSILFLDPVNLGDDEIEITKSSISENSHLASLQFSPLVPVILEALTTMDEKTATGNGTDSSSISPYIYSVLHCILRRQTEPRALCLLLYKYKDLLNGQEIVQIAGNFLPNDFKETLDPLDSSSLNNFDEKIVNNCISNLYIPAKLVKSILQLSQTKFISSLVPENVFGVLTSSKMSLRSLGVKWLMCNKSCLQEMHAMGSTPKKKQKKKKAHGSNLMHEGNISAKLEALFLHWSQNPRYIDLDSVEVCCQVESEVKNMSQDQYVDVSKQCIQYIMWQVDHTDDIAHISEEYFIQLVFSIITRLTTLITENAEETENNSSLKEVEKILVSIVKVVLNHPTLQHLLCHIADHDTIVKKYKKKKLKSKSETRYIENALKCSKLICDIMDLLPPAVVGNISDAASPYVKALERYFSKRTSLDLGMVTDKVLFDTVCAFWRLLDKQSTVNGITFVIASCFELLKDEHKVLEKNVKVLCNMLEHVTMEQYELYGYELPPDMIKKLTLIALFHGIYHDVLGKPVCSLFRNYPPYCKHITPDVFKTAIEIGTFGCCLQVPTGNCNKMLKLTVKQAIEQQEADVTFRKDQRAMIVELCVIWMGYSKECRQVFENWVVFMEGAFSVKGWNINGLVLQYFKLAETDSQTRNILVNHYCKALEDDLNHSKCEVLNLEEELGAIVTHLSKDKITSLREKLADVIKLSDNSTPHHVRLYEKLIEYEKNDSQAHILNICLEGLLKILNKKKEKDLKLDNALMGLITDLFHDIDDVTYNSLHKNIVFINDRTKLLQFVKLGLKRHYNANFFKVLEHMMNLLVISDRSIHLDEKLSNKVDAVAEECLNDLKEEVLLVKGDDEMVEEDELVRSDTDEAEVVFSSKSSSEIEDDLGQFLESCTQSEVPQKVDDSSESSDSDSITSNSEIIGWLNQLESNEGKVDDNEGTGDRDVSNSEDEESDDNNESSMDENESGIDDVEKGSDENESDMEENESGIDDVEKGSDENESDNNDNELSDDDDENEFEGKETSSDDIAISTDDEESGGNINNNNNNNSNENSGESDNEEMEMESKITLNGQLQRMPETEFELQQETTEFINTIYDMLLTHSKFMTVILSNDVEIQASKEYLVKCIATLVEASSSVCKTSHLAVFLGAYNASLSTTDQRLLRIINMYESSGCRLSQYKPYLWGEKAVEHYSVKKDLGSSLWKQPTMMQVIETLNVENMWDSTLNFPLRKNLMTDNVVFPASDLMTGDTCYNPSFVLPLLFHLLTPDNVVHCRKFVENNCLSFVITSLSSHDSNMRGLAYSVLSRYYYHLEGSKFSEKLQILSLLECVKNSINNANMKLPCIVTIFLAKLVKVLLKPDDPMYLELNNFMLIKPNMDMFNVPELYKHFNSSSLEFKTERAWLLNLLIDGLRETADYKIFQRRYTFKLIMAYYNSSLSDSFTQKQVLHVVTKACAIKNAAFDLVKNHGLLPWIQGVIRSDNNGEDVLKIVLKLIHTLWFCLLDKRDKNIYSDRVNVVLPINLITEILLIVKSSLHNTRNFYSCENFHVLLEVLESVLEHGVKSLEYHQSEGKNYYGQGECHIALQYLDVVQILLHWGCQNVFADSRLEKSASEILTVIKGEDYGINLTSDNNMEDSFPLLLREHTEKFYSDQTVKKCVDCILKIILHVDLDNVNLSCIETVASVVFFVHYCLQLSLLVRDYNSKLTGSYHKWVKYLLEEKSFDKIVSSKDNISLISMSKLIEILNHY